MEHVTCNLCGSDRHVPAYEMPDEKFFPEEWFSVVECRDCGLGFVNPRPTEDEIDRHYPAEYFTYFDDPAEDHRRRYLKEALFVDRGDPPGRTLLDIGCANGDFPRFMRERGWEVAGVEPSQAARAIDDFPVYRGRFPNYGSAGRVFDAVTAWAVLEHVHDPAAYFAKAAEVLRPGGIFAFHVTNFESLGSRRLFLEDVPRHLYFFTEPCVRRYLAANGFQLEEAAYDNRIYRMDPANWLVYALAYRLRRRPFRWQEAQNSRRHWLGAHHLDPALANTVRFAASHPLVSVDRALMGLCARIQMVRRTYGVVTYRARKIESES